ncbi:MAG TPA: 16S rRNA (cytosine(1402)-N(4))-methyltransferase RsmH [Acidimicrobiales bacterium]|nr:16S rRNA (cytosine(1402)-N(4))-methyltransferase RsmH [Acidimicrobiales bacterium]
MSQAFEAFQHRPVMVDEIVALLGPVPAGTVVDATVGGGGHSRAILSAHPHLRVLGLDRDADALDAARERLAGVADRVTLVHGRFDGLSAALDDAGIDAISGALFDLGVSSPQLDRADRGFSYRVDAPLDMRMDRSETTPTAADLVNEASVTELAELFKANGETRFAGRIAKAILRDRPVTTTGQLADLVRDAIPAPARRTGGHPAKRVFQALRIAVNAELDVLPVALDAAVDRLAPGGRLVVLSYHSGEDRIVKDRFLAAEGAGCTCPPRLPVPRSPAGETCVCGAAARRTVRLLHRGARKPSAAEVAANPRAESARLRTLEKHPPAPAPDPTA